MQCGFCNYDSDSACEDVCQHSHMVMLVRVMFTLYQFILLMTLSKREGKSFRCEALWDVVKIHGVTL